MSDSKAWLSKWREKNIANKGMAVFLAIFALVASAYYLGPFLTVYAEAVDVVKGVIQYCPVVGNGACTIFLADRWLLGIAGGLAAAGIIYALFKSAAHAWRASTDRYAFELDRPSVLASAITFFALAVSFSVEGIRWTGISLWHETALLQMALTIACIIISATLVSQYRAMSPGEALSIELHRHTQ